MREHSPLPDGYRVEASAGYLRLFDPQGDLLLEEPQGPAAASAIEERAWRDVWKQIHREIKEELAALREGTHPLHELRRVRQYMRLLDAVTWAPREVQEPPRRRDVVSWLALATAAAAIALVLWTMPFRIVRNAGEPLNVTRSRPSTTRPPIGRSVSADKTEPKPARSGRLQASYSMRTTAFPRAARPARVAGTGAGAGQREVARYRVSLGEFTSQAAAEIRMHFIRGKGYLVYVTRIGDSFRVVTRPYRTQAQAQRLAAVLQEIGLPARPQVTEARAL